MTKVNETPSLPRRADSPEMRELHQALAPLLRALAVKVNQLADGKLAGRDEVRASVPTSGTWQAGDIVAKTSPVKAGSAPNTYVHIGWVRVTDGSSNVLGTDWEPMNVPTAAFGGGGGSVLSAEVTVTPPGPGGVLQHSETVTFTGCLPANRIFVSVAPHLDSDENDAEALDIAAISASPGTDQATIEMAFGALTSGPIRLNLMAV